MLKSESVEYVATSFFIMTCLPCSSSATLRTELAFHLAAPSYFDNAVFPIIRLVIFHLPIFYPCSRCLPRSNLRVVASVVIPHHLMASLHDLHPHRLVLRGDHSKITAHLGRRQTRRNCERSLKKILSCRFRRRACMSNHKKGRASLHQSLKETSQIRISN
jgi:hypothetical protein